MANSTFSNFEFVIDDALNCSNNFNKNNAIRFQLELVCFHGESRPTLNVASHLMVDVVVIFINYADSIFEDGTHSIPFGLFPFFALFNSNGITCLLNERPTNKSFGTKTSSSKRNRDYISNK